MRWEVFMNEIRTIDIHTHGILNYDTMTLYENDILKLVEIHGSYGVSHIIPTIYPSTIENMRENIYAVKRAMEMQKNLHKSGISQIVGIHLEGPFLNPSRSGALDASAFIKPTEYNLMKLIDGFEDLVKIITIAPELDGALKLIRKIRDIGIIPSMGHTDATYQEASAGYNAGAKGITHIFNAMRGFHHREPSISGFGLLNQDVYIEVIADPFHLHPKTLELIFKIKNHDRIIIISDTVKGSKRNESGVFDKDGRLLGGCLTIIESSNLLIEKGIIDRETALKCISENPKSYLDLR